jgi:hypothetical protein
MSNIGRLIVQQTFAALLLLTIWRASAISSMTPLTGLCAASDFVLIVGDVGTAHARILIEPCHSDRANIPVSVRVGASLTSILSITLDVPAETPLVRHPRVLHLTNLSVRHLS